MSGSTLACWAIVDLMGHLRLAGKLTEEERFGAKMGRLEIPQADGSFRTEWFGGASVYKISAVTEEVARGYAQQNPSPPVSPWDVRAMMTPKLPPPDRDGDFDSSHIEEDDEDYSTHEDLR